MENRERSDGGLLVPAGTLSRRSLLLAAGGAAVVGAFGQSLLNPGAAFAASAAPQSAADMSSLALSLVGTNFTFASLKSGAMSSDAPWNNWGPSDWCAWFASWLVRAGGGGMQTLASGLYNAYPHVDSPMQGDVIHYDYGHVGVVVAINPDGTPQTVEGNTGSDDFNTSFVKHRQQPWTYPVDFSRPSYPASGSSPVGSASSQQYLAPTAIVLQNGTIALYAIRSDGNLWGTCQTSVGGSFAPWSIIGSAPGTLIGRPSILQMPSGVLAAYARTSSGSIVGTNQSSVGGPFGSWVSIGTNNGGLASDPRAILLASGAIAVYATTTLGNLAGTAQSSVGSSFVAWSQIGSALGTLFGRPAVIQTSGGAIAAYAASTDGYVYGACQSTVGGTFGGWAVMGTAGGGIASEPTATYTGGLLRLYALTRSNTISTVSQSTVGGSFGTWASLGTPGPGANQGAPAVVDLSSGATVVYAHGSDNYVYGSTLTSSGASGWSAIGESGGGVIAAPSAVQVPSGLIAVYSIVGSGAIVASSQSSVGGSFGQWITI